MCTTQSICRSAWPFRLFAIVCMSAMAGCATVETPKPPVNYADRPAAGGGGEAGDPAAPADKQVVSAADDRANDPAAEDSAANPPRDKSATAKASTDQKH